MKASLAHQCTYNLPACSKQALKALTQDPVWGPMYCLPAGMPAPPELLPSLLLASMHAVSPRWDTIQGRCLYPEHAGWSKLPDTVKMHSAWLCPSLAADGEAAFHCGSEQGDDGLQEEVGRMRATEGGGKAQGAHLPLLSA
jgi:hypothetical protein